MAGYLDALQVLQQGQMDQARMAALQQQMAYEKWQQDQAQKAADTEKRLDQEQFQLASPPVGGPPPPVTPPQMAGPQAAPQAPPPQAQPGMGGGMAAMFAPPPQGGPQPPMPGQSSQPMQMPRPPMPPPQMPPQGGPPPMPQGGPPPMAAPPQGAGNAPQPMVTQGGWRPSPAASPALGGQPGGGPPPGMPQVPQMAAPPAAAQEQEEQFRLPKPMTAPQIIQKINSMPIPLEDKPALFKRMMEQSEKDNKRIMNDQLQELHIQVAKAQLEKEMRLGIKAGMPGGTGSGKPPAEMANVIFAAGGDPTKPMDQQSPDVLAKARKMAAAEEGKKGTIISLQVNPEGDLSKDKDTLRELASQAWKGDTSVYTNLGRGAQGAKNIIALRKEVTQVGKEQGKTPAEIGEQLAMANAEFKGMQAGERTLGTRTANIEMAANEARQLSDLALDASNKLPRTGIRSLNEIAQKVESGTASPELRAFTAANTSLINAYARAINPQGVGTVADKEHARDMLSTAFSKGDYAAAVKQLNKEIDAAKASPGAVKSGMRAGFSGGGESSGPKKGDVEGGYKFKGGDPADKANWEKV